MARTLQSTLLARLVDRAAVVAAPAAQIASVMVTEGTRTSLELPSFLTGLGVILMVLLADPVTAQALDEALRGECPESAVVVFSIWQIGAQLAGALAAQLVLVLV